MNVSDLRDEIRLTRERSSSSEHILVEIETLEELLDAVEARDSGDA